MKFEFGQTLRDSISRLTGVYIGYATYITGCNQCLLQPRSDTAEKKPEAFWFDEDRLTLVTSAELVKLPAKTNNGADQEAPKI